jgi:acetoin utilization deacetylase AcuC-like enzyme
MSRRRTATAPDTSPLPAGDETQAVTADTWDSSLELEEDNLPHEPALPDGPNSTLAIFMPRLRPRPSAEITETLPAIWDPRYSVKAAPLNSTEKQARVVALASLERLLSVREVPCDEDATWRSIAEVHDPAYVAAVRTGRPRHLATSQGFSWSRALAGSVARIWNGHLAACRQAQVDAVVFHPVSGAHHACYAAGGSFCTFNFLVGAARAELAAGLSRVAIVDLDAHQGDGTWDLARDDERVAIFDIAGSRWCDVENGDRVEYHEVADAAGYARALARLPHFLDRTRPELIEYQAGADCWEHDPVGSIPGVTRAFLTERDRIVLTHAVTRRIPIVINLGGGYAAEQLHVDTARTARAFVRR